MSQDVIEAKIDVIERNFRFLREYQTMDASTFLSNYKDIQAAKYSLLEIIEACIDIATHVVSARGLERGDSYADLFLILGQHEIIDSALAVRLASMARFRNLLVHAYSKIDNTRVLQVIKEELEDTKEYVREILRYLNSSGL